MSVKDLTILGCSSQQPTRHRNQGGYLFRWNDQGFLFDPGEGTQRQFIHAEIAPTVVNRIFVSHFHGDHCLGLSSMLMRLNLDQVTHPIHCYYPAKGKKYFDRLRYSTIYHEKINVIEHPIDDEGVIDEDEDFVFEAYFLKHGVTNLGYRIQEKPKRRFHKEELAKRSIKGPLVKQLIQDGHLKVGNKEVLLEDVSFMKQGDIVGIVIDTLECENAIKIAQNAKLFLCESTYLSEHQDLAVNHYHLTAKQAAEIAAQASAQKLILTHFSARYPIEEAFAEEARAVFPNTFAAKDLARFSFK